MNDREKGNKIEIINYRKPTKVPYKTKDSIRQEMKALGAAKYQRHEMQKLEKHKTHSGWYTMFKTKKTAPQPGENTSNPDENISDKASHCCVIL